ncbi:MAG TPA: alkaline phosphatase family protein [Stellaceae bacterium]|jgi:arylsulfatase A-like enzyme|nr:alkaline phosphatase family protein [Stellaceae bacterium]
MFRCRFRDFLILPLLAALPLSAAAQTQTAQSQPRHNLVLFVPDGLRAAMVGPETAPAMAALRDRGVNFTNPHSMFPTFTTANASAMATGHYLGDTGDFSNTIYTGFPVTAAGGSVTPFLENDKVIAEADTHFGGNFFDEEALLKAAREAGFSTAAIGKLGPTLMFDHTASDGATTIIVDDATGTPSGVPLSPEVAAALTAAGLPAATPGRGANGKAGDATHPGTTVANVEQQSYLADVATRAVLPLFKKRGKPFVLVFWSRDPDGTQHNQGDSLGRLTPGINGPTSLAGIRNADDTLAKLQQGLSAVGLADTTDIVIAADHGFSTISKESATSASAKATFADTPKGLLPSGFLALDLAGALGMPLLDPDAKNAPVAPGAHPAKGNGLIGGTVEAPDIVVAANGGSDLIYLPTGNATAKQALAAKVLSTLLAEDYISGLFVDDALGRFPGTLPLSAINLNGAAVTPLPAIAVNFRSFDTGCDMPVRCTAELADTPLQQGQGMHGSFSRADTMNFMAAAGPDFKPGLVDPAPVSNADIGKTLAHLLGLKPVAKGHLVGRVIDEALPGSAALPQVARETVASDPSPQGLRTVVDLQRIGETRYFDAAGFPGRTVGLSAAPTANPTNNMANAPAAR